MTSCDDSEANWNGRTGRQTDRQDHALSQADALTKDYDEDIRNTLETGILVSYKDPTPWLTQ